VIFLVKELDASLRTGRQLAEYVHGLSFADLPDEVVHQVKRVTLDSLGTILMGLRKQEAQPVKSFLKGLGAKPECTVARASLKTACSWAAFANASYAQVHDCNDGHRDSAALGGSAHPGRTVIPTALAVAEKLGSSGRDVITSTVIGYDVATRIRGIAKRPPSATQSSAAVAAHLMGLEQEKTQFALSVAAFTSPKAFPESLTYDTNFLHCGYEAKTGVEAAWLAAEGFNGPPMGDDRKLSTRFRERGLGREYEIMDVYMKPWPTCRMTHGAVEAVLALREEAKIAPDDVEEIQIQQLTHGMYITESPVDVDSYYKTCQFNLPYIAAVALIDGKVTEAQFTRERIADKAVHDLAKKIKVKPDEDLDAIYPDQYRPTTVEVKTKKGEAYKKVVQNPYGDPRNTLDDDALYEKFRFWAGPSLTEEQARDIRDVVWRLDKLSSLSELMELIA
jgi:2-methylcitrate dehydratase PrpD